MLALEVSSQRVVDRKYELVELLGLGSMGEVWTARHLGLGQTCAVKLMARETHEAPDAAVLRFTREARIAAALSRKSRHIVAVTDFGNDECGPYLVMELLDGQPLDECLVRGCKAEEAALIVSQIAKGLGVAHREGILHRDLKPANVFLTRDDEGAPLVKLLDFGIARLMMGPLQSITVQGVIVGSPAYMSPEHVQGDPLDARADVWSLGVLAFETLTGQLPFAAETTPATLQRIAMFNATPIHTVYPAATPALEAFFARAFARKIEDRFQRAEDLARAFADALAAPMVEVIEVVEAIEAPKRDRKRLAAIAALSAVAIGAGALLVARSSSSSTVAEPAHDEPIVVASAAPPPPAETKVIVESATPTSPPPVVQPKAKPIATTAPTPTPTPKTKTKPEIDPSAIF